MSLRYDPPGSQPSGECQPGCVAAKRPVLNHWQFAYDLGCYAPRNVGGTNKPSEHLEGRARDFGVPQPGRGKADPRGWGIAECFRVHADALSVELVIFDRKVWSVGRRQYGWRPYDGQSPHLDHVHVGWNWDGALHNTEALYERFLPSDPTIPVLPPKDELMLYVPFTCMPTLFVNDGGGWHVWYPDGTCYPVSNDDLTHYKNLGWPIWKDDKGNPYRAPANLIDNWLEKANDIAGR